MAIAPVHRLKKSEIIWLAGHHCKSHRHPYLEHYNCFLSEQPNTERIAVWDIETSNLDADYGIILTWCVMPLDKPDQIIEGCISKDDITRGRKGDEDRRVVRELVETIGRFDKLIGYYSKRYDAPYVRARAVHMGITFPQYDTLKHLDVYDMVRRRFKISRKSQENACRFLLGSTEKTHFNGSIWRDAARGDKKALRFVLDHNRGDVRDLNRLYTTVVPFTRRNDTSI